jgi:hypothetical protein
MSWSRTCIGLGVTAAAAALILRPADAQTVPTDAQPTCAIPPPAFANMFESGTVTLNGVVRPADSTVSLTSDCAFFSWTEQMYLWLTSPAPARYGGGGRIMFSPAFYTVTPQSGGRRNFLRNDPRRPIRMMLRATELGPHLLPALLARTGQVVEVARPDPRRPVPPVVRLQTGASVRLGDVRRTPAGTLQFFDARGRQVQVRRLALPTLRRTMVRMPDGRQRPVVPVASVRDAIQARQLVFHGVRIFIDANNNVIDVEPGQAGGGGVLLSQNGSLIYYIIAVNDVFAYHRTMQGAAVIPTPTGITFPMTMADANAVVAFAAQHGTRIVDPEALAIETKSSWVEASAVPNPDDYVQVDATIPVFDTSNPNMWVPVPNQERRVRLVMVGLHVVGSTLGHGEMVWGSFEHLGNAPNAAYTYDSITGPRTIPQNMGGTWLFSPSGWAGPYNPLHASWDDTTGNIDGIPGGSPILPTPVLRMRPWGSDGSDAFMNTQVISSNASVIGQLAPHDVRRNYFQLGTTWTKGGDSPTPTNQVGTNQLANGTMETFMQAIPPGSSTNCFSCHGSNTVAVSHVYRIMNPLP